MATQTDFSSGQNVGLDAILEKLDTMQRVQQRQADMYHKKMLDMEKQQGALLDIQHDPERRNVSSRELPDISEGGRAVALQHSGRLHYKQAKSSVFFF